MAQPLLQLKKRHGFSRVVKLGSDSRAGSLTGDVAAHIGERNTGLLTESRDERLVQLGYFYPGKANEKEKIDQFASLEVGESYALWTHLLPCGDGLADNTIYGLGEGSGGLVEGIHQTLSGEFEIS